MNYPVSRREQHFTDYRIGGNKKRRQIKNWCNYKEPGRNWRPSNQVIHKPIRVPDNWSGLYDFRYQSISGPLQVFFGDATDPSNTALIGVRRSDVPGAWLNLKALQVDNVVPVETPDQRTLKWSNLWDNCDLEFKIANHKLEKVIKLNQPGTRTIFRFALKIPNGYTLEVANNRFRILDDQGEEKLRSKPVNGWDSSTVAPTIDGTQSIGVTLERGNDITYRNKTYPVLKITVDQNDLDTAVYPVYIDPTTEISGTGSIADNIIRSNQTSDNIGGWTDCSPGVHSGGTQHTIWKLLDPTNDIPSGTIIGATFYFWRGSNGSSANGNTLSYHKILSANASWVEGTSGPWSTQAGSSCWDYAQYDTVSWAGSAGLGTADTDYDSTSTDTESYSGYTSGPDVAKSASLDADWFEPWRDEDEACGGWIQRTTGITNGSLYLLRSTEYGSGNNPYVELTVAEPDVRPFVMLLGES